MNVLGTNLVWESQKENYLKNLKKMVKLINLDKQNRMLRFGFGKHNGTWFMRLDLWWFGIRIFKIN
tara:strand:- start:947 stop:1144 length:198 start_codon:yes stop_codon:yes gene_type:complete